MRITAAASPPAFSRTSLIEKLLPRGDLQRHHAASLWKMPGQVERNVVTPIPRFARLAGGCMPWSEQAHPSHY